MNEAAKIAYVHEVTGNVIVTTAGQARFLDDAYKPVTFHEKDGKRFMRIKLKGATVDVAENDAGVLLNG